MYTHKLAIATIASTLLFACNPPPPDTGAKGNEQTQQEAAPSNPFAGLGGMGALSMLGNLDKPGPYEDLAESPELDAKAPHYAVIELEGLITEKSAMGMLGSPKTIELRRLTKRLHKLATDDNIQGVLLRFGEVQASLPTADEVRRLLVAFGEQKGDRAGPSGAVLCHGDNAIGATYHMMTGCDKVAIESLGMVMVPGTGAAPIYLKNALDKLGVQADFLQMGAYKGAAEPLTRSQPSPEMQETYQAILDQGYETLVAGMTEGRGVARDTAVELIDESLFYGEQAIANKLVDAVKPYPDFRNEATGGKWKQIKLSKKSSGLDLMALQRFLGAAPPQRPSEPHVGLIYAIGPIVEGDGGGALGASETIGGRTLSAAIRAMGRDDKVAAIVLRVNSPGGSANASEQIWAAVNEAKANKPVVVSMGNVAGSGGYYISCNANKIFALPDTMTGSIGVIGGKLAIGKALENIGITTHAMAKGKQALMWSPYQLWTDDERATVRKMMEHTYKVFVTRVSDGRGKAYDDVHKVAQGRVWTGADAHKHGLVDELGSLEDALAEARKLGKVGDDVGLEVYPPEPTLRDFIKGFGSMAVGMPSGWASWLGSVAEVMGPLEAGAVSDVFAQALQLQTEPVLTATMFPMVLR